MSMTNAAGWTDADGFTAWCAYQEARKLDMTNGAAMRAALSAIGAVRQTPDEPSDETMKAMRRAWTDCHGDRDELIRVLYAAARLTLAAPGVGAEREYETVLDGGAMRIRPKPTAPEPEYETVDVARITLSDGTVFITHDVGDYRSAFKREFGTAKFPKPATCKTCGQTKKVAG